LVIILNLTFLLRFFDSASSIAFLGKNVKVIYLQVLTVRDLFCSRDTLQKVWVSGGGEPLTADFHKRSPQEFPE
jgi:hypothetical protein